MPKKETSKSKKPGGDDSARLPRHIAVIMDGNGRWARRRGLPRVAGHRVGAERFREIATHCKEIGIEYFTVYAFSTENWKRPTEEVSAIMNLLEKYLHEAIAKMERDQIRMKFFGDTSILSNKLQTLIRETEEISARTEGMQVNICLNYGARDEILRAAQKYARDFAAGHCDDLTEFDFSQYLFSAGICDPDIVIRPGGERRLSNFLLWQVAYSEFYFTDLLWPEFTTQELDRAIEDFQSRDRRYGNV